jgi:hypothetical protein
MKKERMKENFFSLSLLFFVLEYFTKVFVVRRDTFCKGNVLICMAKGGAI